MTDREIQLGKIGSEIISILTKNGISSFDSIGILEFVKLSITDIMREKGKKGK